MPAAQAHAFSLVRIAVITIAAVALAWLSFAATWAMVFARNSASQALMLGYPSAQAQATLATKLLADPAPASTSKAEAGRLANASLRRDLSQPAAYVALGLLAELAGQQQRARAQFLASEQISRRELTTQLWLIENRVSAGDIDGALLHYNRGLSSSRTAGPLLLPVLVDAAAQQADVARPLAAMIANRPLWWPDLVRNLIDLRGAPVGQFRTLVAPLRLDPHKPDERGLLAGTIQRLVQGGALGDAAALYAQALGAYGLTQPLRDGGFEEDPLLPPFDWEIINDNGRAGIIETRDGSSGRALTIQSGEGKGGTVARQLLRLSPGRYQLSFVAAEVAGDELARPAVAIACGDADAAPVAMLRLPVTHAPHPFSLAFSIPPVCTAPWLTISAGSSLDSRDTAPWIDSLQVHSLGKARQLAAAKPAG